ncbi:hypothetical protein FRC02_000604 [Tulasnella sp. 418]|nr:hypothetical protein FRC02_000604 [Tulasnella sp. 418]
MSVLITSSGTFEPRKEFQKSQATPHQFALLAFNGGDILRLSNFPPNVIGGLRALFQSQGLYRGYGEDAELGVSEFIMTEKVWSGKSIRTERLVTQLFAVIFSFNFKYVTDIAYGRLAQDTRSLVFSRSVTINPNHPFAMSGLSINSRTNSPHSVNKNLPVPPSAVTAGPSSPKVAPSENGKSASNAALNPPRTTFAISLTSKLLRVINPPRTSTPAILNSVRSAWPRGVIDESRPEDDVYEFKLKGYSFFKSNTFDRDALFHIFSLLRSLDAYSFSLITNLNLSQGIARSRSKDLWIFEAPADPASPESEKNSIHTMSPHTSRENSNDVSRIAKASISSDAGFAGVGAGLGNSGADEKHALGVSHTRASSAPSEYDRRSSSDHRSHGRGASSPAPAYTPYAGGSKPPRSPISPISTKKPAPSAFGGAFTSSPISKFSSTSTKGKRNEAVPDTPITEHLPDEAAPSRGVTTIGPLSESEYNYDYNPPNNHPISFDPGSAHPPSEYLYNRYTGGGVGGVIYSSKEAVSTPDQDPAPYLRGSTAPPPPGHSQSQKSSPTDERLLSPNAFRDSSVTTSTSDNSREVPIAWKGPIPEEDEEEGVDPVAAPPTSSAARAGSVPSPVQPGFVQVDANKLGEGSGANEWRKSEKGIVETMPTTVVPGAGVPPLPTSPTSPTTRSSMSGAPRVPSRMLSTTTVLPPGGFPRTPKDSFGGGPLEPTKSNQSSPTSHRRAASPDAGAASSGKGWVLVNIEPSTESPSAANGGAEDGQQSGQVQDLASPPMSPGGGEFGYTYNGGGAPVGSRPKRALSKRRKTQERRKSSSSSGTGNGGKKRFLGLFGSRKRKGSSSHVKGGSKGGSLPNFSGEWEPSDSHHTHGGDDPAMR